MGFQIGSMRSESPVGKRLSLEVNDFQLNQRLINASLSLFPEPVEGISSSLVRLCILANRHR